MPQIGQAQQGTLSSSPKVCSLKGDDNLKVIYKNMGNGHVVPNVWSANVTMSGTEVTVVSGITIHGMALASYATVTATPLGAIGTVGCYVEKDTDANTIKIKASGALSNVDFDVILMLGNANADIATMFG